MKNDIITIYNQKIYPGEHVSIALPLPELFSCAPMYMPLKVIHGKQAGPRLLVISTMQGDQRVHMLTKRKSHISSMKQVKQCALMNHLSALVLKGL